MYLSKERRKILKYFNAIEYVSLDDFLASSFKRIQLDDMINLNFVEEFILCPRGAEGREFPLYGYRITPAGQSALSENVKNNVHLWINTFIAITALIISLLQLLTPLWT